MNIAFLLGERAVITLSEKIRNEQAFDSRAEPFLLLQLLSKHNPHNNYYVIDCVGYLNKYTKEQYIKDFPNQNVFFPVNPYAERIKALGLEENLQCTTMSKEAKEILDEMVDYLVNEIKLDYGISFYTYNNQGIPGITRKKTKPEEFARLRISDARSKYGVYFLNESNLPYITYVVDMRYIKNSATLCNTPKAIAGFKNGEITINTINGTTYEHYKNKDFTDKTIPMRYVYTDTLLSTMLDPEELKKDYEKDIKLITFFNQQSDGIDRMQFLVDFGLFKEFNKEELQVYSNLKRIKKTDDDYDLNGHSTQFTVPHDKMIELMQRSKYTLIVPTYLEFTEMSAKPWENMFTQTIPFMVDDKYGSKEWRDIHNMPEFFFVKDVHDLRRKIEILESCPKTKQLYINQMKTKISEIISGRLLNEALNNLVQEFILDKRE